MLPVLTSTIPQTSSAEFTKHHQAKRCWRPGLDKKCVKTGKQDVPERVRSYLGEVSQVGPHPAQLVQHAGVEGRLLLAAAAQLLLAGVVDARPVGGEGLGTVRPDAPGDTTAQTPQQPPPSLFSLQPQLGGQVRFAAWSSQEHLNLQSSQCLIQVPVEFPSLQLQ